MTTKSRRYCFTINNPTDDDHQTVADFLDSSRVTYGIVGRETGESGTPHLQGFCILAAPQRFAFLHTHLCARAHLEVARAKSNQASEYCKKEGDFDEYGTLPDNGGKRSDIDEFKQWITNQSTRPSEREIARSFPGLFLRYRSSLMALTEHLSPYPVFGIGDDLRGWQQQLDESLDEEPDDRSIIFCVDPDGNSGKSYYVRYRLSKYPDYTQALSIGKRDDLCCCIDETKRVFLFDIPRGGMEFLQYTVLEKLKDQVIFSGKYQSSTKLLPHPVHVVVFCNEPPDVTKMTGDRYKYIDIN